MTRFEDHRMSFEPSDDAYRGFDLSEDEETARGPLILALALGVLVVFGAVVWNTYRQGVRAPGDVPLIRAESGPYKTAAEDQTDGRDDRLGNTFFDQFEAPTSPDRTLGRDDSLRVTGTGTDRSPEPEMLQGGPAIDLVDSLGASGEENETAAPREDQLQALAELATRPLPVDPQLALQPDSAPAIKEVPAPDTAGISNETTATVPQPARTQPDAPEGYAADGAYLVQLAAFRSAAAADEGWTRARAEFPTLLAGTDKQVQRADLDAKGVFYRLRVGAFESRETATAFCQELKAAGADCIVVGAGG